MYTSRMAANSSETTSLTRSSIERIPNEILSAIFQLSMHHPQCAEEAIDRHRDLYRGPTRITRVSSRWRRVGIATSNLWTTIVLLPCPKQTSQKRNNEANQKREKIAALWLDRSRARPLTLCFELAPAFNLFAPHSHRWEQVFLTGIGSKLADKMVMLDLPALRSLEVVSKYAYALSRRLATLPELRKLVWEGRWDSYIRDAGTPIWVNLTEINLDGMYGVGQVLHILLEAQCLESCRVRTVFGGLEHDTDINTTPFTAECITAFRATVMLEDTDEARARVDLLWSLPTAPVMHTFHLEYTNDESDDESPPRWDTPTPNFVTFIARTQGAIENLTLWSVWLPEDMMLSVLELVPDLTTLEIVGARAWVDDLDVFDLATNVIGRWEAISFTKDALQCLTRGADSVDCLCPKLTRMQLDDCVQAETEVVEAMITSRVGTLLYVRMVMLHNVEILHGDIPRRTLGRLGARSFSIPCNAAGRKLAYREC